MDPSGIILIERDFTLNWLLTGVADAIDLNRMSTADRRDFPVGVSGSHMAINRETCFKEIQFSTPPPRSYLLTFSGHLTCADYTKIPDQRFSGSYYDPDHGYSQDVFMQNSGEFAKLSCDGILRFSYPAYRSDSYEEVVALFPPARQKLQLTRIEAIGNDSPPIDVIPFGQKPPVRSDEFRR